MGKRTVGKGQGAVFVGGQRFLEGEDIPANLEVGKHVFDDYDDEAPKPLESSIDGATAEEPSGPPAVPVSPAGGGDGEVDGVALVDGTVDEVLKGVGDDQAKAQAALDAEQAKGDKARSSLVEKLQAIAGGS